MGLDQSDVGLGVGGGGVGVGGIQEVEFVGVWGGGVRVVVVDGVVDFDVFAEGEHGLADGLILELRLFYCYRFRQYLRQIILTRTPTTHSV